MNQRDVAKISGPEYSRADILMTDNEGEVNFEPGFCAVEMSQMKVTSVTNPSDLMRMRIVIYLPLDLGKVVRPLYMVLRTRRSAWLPAWQRGTEPWTSTTWWTDSMGISAVD